MTKIGECVGNCKDSGGLRSIGIVTLIGEFNYGNRLQNYAVAKLIEAEGFSAITLDFPPRLCRRVKNQIKRLLGMPLSPEDQLSIERRERFKSFNELLHFRQFSRYSSTPKGFDGFVVGSDQIWNPYYMLGPRVSFLEFTRSSKKIALSPSFGVSVLPQNVTGSYRAALYTFPRISVREKAGAQIVANLTGKDAVVLSDPTIGLTAEQWREVSSSDCTPSERFVFVYMLGEIGELERQAIEEVAAFEHASIVMLSDREREGEVEAGPAEFLDLVDHAVHVVTNSFHGSVFSMLFETPLTILGRNEEDDTSSRLKTLVDTFSLQEHVHGSSAYCPTQIDSYEIAVQVIDEERLRIRSYLHEELARIIAD